VSPALALGALALVLAGPAGATVGSLPSPTAPIRPEPPLQTPTSPFSTTERRFPQRLDSKVIVRVGVDSSGKPVRMTALDRVVVHGTGDYSFSIPAPASAVTAGAGSASQPGLRSGAILWQGFSSNRRLLVAQVTLDPSRAAKALPIAVTIAQGDVRLRNVTATTARVTTGPASASAVSGAMASARAAVRKGQLVSAPPIVFTGPTRIRPVEIRTRLRVTGFYRFEDGGRRTVAAWLDAEPLRLTGRGELRELALQVVPEDPATPLRETGRMEVAARRLFESALADQYRSFLANPDPAGSTATTYRYRLAGAQAARETADSGGSQPWAAIIVAVAAVSAAAAGVVLWAHR
jgi:hypothetical protein